jgi:hypothetical protein
MDWLLQSSGALVGLTVTLITIGFLVHMSSSSKPDARMAFLTGLMKGAALEDLSQNACSAKPMVHRSLDSNSPRLA